MVSLCFVTLLVRKVFLCRLYPSMASYEVNCSRFAGFVAALPVFSRSPSRLAPVASLSTPLSALQFVTLIAHWLGPSVHGLILWTVLSHALAVVATVACPWLFSPFFLLVHPLAALACPSSLLPDPHSLTTSCFFYAVLERRLPSSPFLLLASRVQVTLWPFRSPLLSVASPLLPVNALLWCVAPLSCCSAVLELLCCPFWQAQVCPCHCSISHIWSTLHVLDPAQPPFLFSTGWRRGSRTARVTFRPPIDAITLLLLQSRTPFRKRVACWRCGCLRVVAAHCRLHCAHTLVSQHALHATRAVWPPVLFWRWCLPFVPHALVPFPALHAIQLP